MTDEKQDKPGGGAMDVGTTTNTDETKGESIPKSQVSIILEERLAKQAKNIRKEYEGVDVERYRALLEEDERRKTEAQEAKGEYQEIILQERQKSNKEKDQLKEQLYNEKVTNQLVNAASNLGAVNAAQVTNLLKDKVRLNDDGTVEVLDESGNAKFNAEGKTMSVKEYVEEFLNTNTHFKKATTPGGSNTVSNTGGVSKKSVDTNIDFQNAGERQKLAAKLGIKLK